MESGPGALPGFKCWRAAANSRWEKLPETFAGCNGSAPQGQTLPVKRAEMSVDSHLRISRF